MKIDSIPDEDRDLQTIARVAGTNAAQKTRDQEQAPKREEKQKFFRTSRKGGQNVGPAFFYLRSLGINGPRDETEAVQLLIDAHKRIRQTVVEKNNYWITLSKLKRWIIVRLLKVNWR